MPVYFLHPLGWGNDGKNIFVNAVLLFALY